MSRKSSINKIKRNNTQSKNIEAAISIDRNIYNEIGELTTNKSMLIEWLLLEYFKSLSKDISNIYL